MIVALSSCLDPTQITLRLTTNVQCSGVSITVGLRDSVEQGTPSASVLCTGRELGTVVLVPAASSSVGVRVVACLEGKTPEACVADGYKGGCIVARRSISYIAHTELSWPITLEASCIDLPCEPTTTCVGGQCIPVQVGSCDGRGDCNPPDAGPPTSRAFGGDSTTAGNAIALDANGSVYLTGVAHGNVSFGGARISATS